MKIGRQEDEAEGERRLCYQEEQATLHEYIVEGEAALKIGSNEEEQNWAPPRQNAH